jgi:hypothetical protein
VAEENIEIAGYNNFGKAGKVWGCYTQCSFLCLHKVKRVHIQYVALWYGTGSRTLLLLIPDSHSLVRNLFLINTLLDNLSRYESALVFFLDFKYEFLKTEMENK